MNAKKIANSHNFTADIALKHYCVGGSEMLGEPTKKKVCIEPPEASENIAETAATSSIVVEHSEDSESDFVEVLKHKVRVDRNPPTKSAAVCDESEDSELSDDDEESDDDAESDVEESEYVDDDVESDGEETEYAVDAAEKCGVYDDKVEEDDEDYSDDVDDEDDISDEFTESE